MLIFVVSADGRLDGANLSQFSELIKRIADIHTQKQRQLSGAEASDAGQPCFLYTSFILIGNKNWAGSKPRETD